jgi:hypothetical protein
MLYNDNDYIKEEPNVYSYNNIIIDKLNTLFIVDWDDTIFASSLLTTNTLKKNTLMKRMNRVVDDFINVLYNLGNVIIVTSSRGNWVKLTSEKYFDNNIQYKLSKMDVYYVEETLKEMGCSNLIRLEDKKSLVFEHVIKKHLIKTDVLKEFISVFNPLNIISNNKLKYKRDLNIITIGDGIQESNAFFYIQQNSKSFDNYNLIYKHVEYLQNPDTEILIEENLLVKKMIELIRNKKRSIYYKLDITNNKNVFIYEAKIPAYFLVPKMISYCPNYQ